MKSDLVDIEVHLHVATERAVLVSLDGERINAVWIPKSQGEIECKGKNKWMLTLPERTAIEKGLV